MSEIALKLVADGFVIIIALIGASVLLTRVPKSHRLDAYARVTMAGVTSLLVARFVAVVFQPATQRPFEMLGTTPGAAYLDNPGFPSDHALFATAIVLAVWFETGMRRVSLFLAAMTIVMCIGRVVALVHTPLDVVGGIVIAGVGVLWYQWRPFPPPGKLHKRKHHHTTHSHKIQK